MKMRILIFKPIEEPIVDLWNSVGRNYKFAFVWVAFINLLAFGFEMSNLTLHHDDICQILNHGKQLGRHVGRFGLGWFHYYTQNAYSMPFLQMVEGVIFMSLYGLLVAYTWGVKKTLDMVLIASIMCVFPYMAQIYQYNTAVATYSLAHLLVAIAVILSIRATLVNVAAAAALFVVTFSIYQSVISCAAVIFSIWLLGKILFLGKEKLLNYKLLVRSSAGVLLSVIVGGIVYVSIVSVIGFGGSSYQSVDKAFDLKDGLNLSYAASEIIHGTRSFFFWPQHYFPYHLKLIQLLFLAAAGILCLYFARGNLRKGLVVFILSLTILLPRFLQLLHPTGDYHDLTLTGYAVLVAGMVMLVIRTGGVMIRNFSCIIAIILIFGYVVQCNGISTVNNVNMFAHYSTMTQILTRIKSLPSDQWIGRPVYVVGDYYHMSSPYPFKKAVGVSPGFIDAEHMQCLAQLLREDTTFVAATSDDTSIMNYAKQNLPWPHSSSVGVVKGVGAVVVLSMIGDDAQKLGNKTSSKN